MSSTKRFPGTHALSLELQRWRLSVGVTWFWSKSACPTGALYQRRLPTQGSIAHSPARPGRPSRRNNTWRVHPPHRHGHTLLRCYESQGQAARLCSGHGSDSSSCQLAVQGAAGSSRAVCHTDARAASYSTFILPPGRIFSIFVKSHSLLHRGQTERVLCHLCRGTGR